MKVGVATEFGNNEGTRCAIRLETNATSRDNRSSLETRTAHLRLRASARLRRQLRSAVERIGALPVSASTNSATIVSPSVSAKRATVARYASMPKPADAPWRPAKEQQRCPFANGIFFISADCLRFPSVGLDEWPGLATTADTRPLSHCDGINSYPRQADRGLVSRAAEPSCCADA